MEPSVEVYMFNLAASHVPKLWDVDDKNEELWKPNIIFWLRYLGLSKYVLEDVPIPVEGTAGREVYNVEVLAIEAALWEALGPAAQMIVARRGWKLNGHGDPKALWNLIMATFYSSDSRPADDLAKLMDSVTI
ncbi:tRNA dihydrouridine synthase [Hypoxylon texense]